MFENLTKKLSGVFDKLSFKKELSENDVNTALREIRIALLEADVALPVAKNLMNNIKEKAVGEKIIKSVSPAQQIIKIVNDELTFMLGEANTPLNIEEKSKNTQVILMAGLQGSGKTTSSAKLAKLLKEKQNLKVLMASADIYRPAAREQLETLGKQITIDTLSIIEKEKPNDIAKRALNEAKDYDVLIFDTAGRLHIDKELMKEIESLSKILKPCETILCVDSMIGQDSVNVAKEFNDKLALTGIVLTRIDGDSRGGAALSMKAITNVPIKFLGTGEKTDALEPFHPDRLANRILGMGDIVSLVEKAQENIDTKEAEKMVNRFFSGNFDFNDMLKQIHQMKKMGGGSGIMKFLPGMSKIQDQMKNSGFNDDMVKKQEAIIYSMSKAERKNPEILLAARKKRIAKGSGTSVSDVEKLIKQFQKTQKMMEQMQSMGGLSGMMDMVKDMQKSGDMPSIPGIDMSDMSSDLSELTKKFPK